jgi:hypothetical protein
MEGNISFEKTEANFTIIANHILRDNRVSLKARGLYATIQGFPDSWNMSIKGLESILKDGKDSIRASLKELIEFGYIEYSKFQNEKGYWMHKYKLLISPKTEIPKVENPKAENPTSENPTSEIPTSGNPPQLINNKSNTQVIKKQVLNIIPDFSENCTDLSANADESSNFEVNTISSFSNTENFSQEIQPLKSQNLNLKQKEKGSFGTELIQRENELTVKPIKDPYPCPIFKRLWVGYSTVAKGKQGGKDVAYRAWLKVKNKASLQDFEKAIAAYSLSKRVKDGYIQKFATFLNSGQWETELENGSQSMQAEIDRAKTRALIEQLDAELEEEYKAGTRRRP